MVTTISQTRTHALKLADEMCYCSKQIILALNDGDMKLYYEWADKQFELSKEYLKIECTRLADAEKEHEVLIKQAEIERIERSKRTEEAIKQAKVYIQNYNYNHCLSVVK